MPHVYFSYMAVGLGILPGISGLGQMLKPLDVMRSVHLSLPQQSESQNLASGLLRLTAIRNMVISSSIVLVWLRTGDERTISLMMLGAASMAAVDGAVLRNLTCKSAAKHWVVITICMAVSAGLWGFFD